MGVNRQTVRPDEGITYAGYHDFLDELRRHIQQGQIAAATELNRQVIRLYWDIGQRLGQKMREAEWGDGVLYVLSQDLREAFPKSKGFSRTNLYNMRLLATFFDDGLPKEITKLPWGHVIRLMHRVKAKDAQLWYAEQTLEYGWSRSVLEVQIDTDLYGREGKAITNFQRTLPSPQSDLAQQITRDPYCFDFLTLRKDYIEKELEGALTEHVRKMLLALGNGFAYLGNQYPITVDGVDFFIDMLFFHVKLNCFVVVELKATEFQPEYAGKLNFYLTAVDNLLRGPDHNPTVGLLLCKDRRGKTIVEWSLADIGKPMGVSSYTTTLSDHLPEDLESALPSREELEARLSADFLNEAKVEPAPKA